ncbi:MAG: hypothetical protein ISS82_06175 [Nanoarchaeota archaeon]|nr:hypothetical protein [Nanoarchaeota archaeon]
MNLVDDRRKIWKERFKTKLEKSQSPEIAMISIVQECIYYSKDIKELRRRLKKLLQGVKQVLVNVIATRGKEFDRNELEEISKTLSKPLHKLNN